MLWTIRRKLTAVTLLAVLFLVAVGGTGLWGAEKASAAAVRERQLSLILEDQLDGRSAGNGVRADVFESIAVSDATQLSAATAEYANFSAELQAATATVASSKSLPAALRPAARTIDSEATAVIDLGSSAVGESHFQPAVAIAKAQQFSAGFNTLSNNMDSLRTDLDAVATRTQRSATSAADLERWVLICALGAALVALFVFNTLVARSIVRPLNRCVAGLELLARRDLTATFGRPRGDEVGRMVRALTSAVGDIRTALGEIADRSKIVDTASHQLSAVSQQLAATAEETASQARSVSSAARTVNDNVDMVATGTAELSGSMREVADNASDAAATAREAASLADRAEIVLAALRDSSLSIGNTVTVIRGVAEQTHLLALNATIEAARAGAAGRGFAVVAEEVKTLARTTSDSTDDVAEVVMAMQGSVREVVDVIARIASTVRGIDDNQSTIAHAVEEQTFTAGSMRNGVAEAAAGIAAITANIDSVAVSAAATTEGVTAAQRAADGLAQTAAELASLASGFKY